MSSAITLKGYALSIDGLQVSYQSCLDRYTLSFDPLATCELFKSVSLIEDFDRDSNGEPVILFTDTNESQGYGFELWHRFVQSFPFTEQMAALIADGHYQESSHRKLIDKVNALLTPIDSF